MTLIDKSFWEKISDTVHFVIDYLGTIETKKYQHRVVSILQLGLPPVFLRAPGSASGASTRRRRRTKGSSHLVMESSQTRLNLDFTNQSYFLNLPDSTPDSTLSVWHKNVVF